MMRLRISIKRTMDSTVPVVVMVVFFLVHLALPQQIDAAAAECCSKCIGKTSKVPYDYDPLIFAECNKRAPDGICCFDCGTFGAPKYGDTVSFASDGSTAQIKSGGWIKFQWSDVSNVTYIQVRDKQNEKKKNTPTIKDTQAIVQDGYFFICAKSVGTIYFRGWGKDTCRQATPETKVLVTEGSGDSDSCDANSPDIPNDAKTSSVKGCNLNRAVIKELPNGEKACTCTADWAGPPECVDLPWWKWAFTIGGGLAAVFSIAVSVRAFLNKKKKREEEELLAEENLKRNFSPTSSYDDLEPLDIHAEPPDTGEIPAIMESPTWEKRSNQDRVRDQDLDRRRNNKHREFTL